MGDVHHKEACPRCTRKGRDTSKDNLTVYTDGSAFCFACGYTKPSKEWLENNGYSVGEDEYNEEVMSKEKLTKEENEKIKGYTGTKGHGIREITDETYRYYGVRHKYSEETGEPVAQYYPVTENYEASGYKVRELPKTFSVVGKCGKESDLFGQWRYKNTSGKFVVITAGEIDCLSAHQMFEDERKSKGLDFDPIPVVSATIGETGSAKQISNHYEWLDRFDKVIICYDMDAAGQEALATLSKVIPKGKMFSMSLPLKDINLMLTEGKQKQFITAFWKARAYTPQGIVGSGDLLESVIKEAYAPRIEFPPFMREFNDMTAGGPALGTIGIISAFTGAAKSTIVNESCYHWLFNIKLRIGVISMEQNSGQYGELMLSRHINIKLGAMRREEKIALLEEQWVKDKARELFLAEDGSDRWFVIDDRDCPISTMKKRIEQLIVECGCQIIVWDTISDSMDMLTIDEQAQLMMWMKGVVTEHGVSFILIAHQRKVASGEKDGSKGGMGSESGVQGTSTLVKSAAWVLVASRDKLAEDDIVKNTTNLFLLKNRGAGFTGECGKLYYDNNSHRLHALGDWLNMGVKDF